MSEKTASALRSLASAGLLLCLVLFIFRSGPLTLKLPATVLSHTGPVAKENERGLQFLAHLSETLPQGATVVVLKPAERSFRSDIPLYLFAAGQLPLQRVLPAWKLDTGGCPEYVAAFGSPFADPRYVLVTAFPEGGVYRLAR